MAGGWLVAAAAEQGEQAESTEQRGDIGFRDH